jgi:class 3 adenylate cyclase
MHLVARVMVKAGAGQVLVSTTVRELLAGSGLRFVDLGVRELKGGPRAGGCTAFATCLQRCRSR